MGNLFTTFTNCRLCISGQLVEGERLVVSQDSGEILKSTGYIGGEIVDLDDAIIAPGFLDLYSCIPPNDGPIEEWIVAKAEQYLKQGVTGYWITTYKFPHQTDALSQAIANLSLSGPAQLGTHISCQTSDAANSISAKDLPPNLKLATLPVSCTDQISRLSDRGVKIAMIPESATDSQNDDRKGLRAPSNYAQAESALYAGATAIAKPLATSMTADDPGPLGLLALHDRLAPYLLLPADGGIDGVNGALHPRTSTLLFRASLASKGAILCSSSSYHAIAGDQTSDADVAPVPAVVATSAQEAVGMDALVRNVYFSANCDIAQAVQAATENVASFMGLSDRGSLAEGCRADFVVLDDGGNVKQTWIGGRRVWPTPTDEDEDDYW